MRAVNKETAGCAAGAPILSIFMFGRGMVVRSVAG